MNFRNVLKEIEIFLIVYIFDRNEFFFEHFDQNWDFSKILTKIEIFEIFVPKSKPLWNFDRSGDFYEIFIEMKTFQNLLLNSKFFATLDQKGYCQNLWPKSKYFDNFQRNRDLWYFLPKSKFFKTFQLLKFLFEIEIFRDFKRNRDFRNFDRYWFIGNFDRNRDFWYFLTNWKCVENFNEIEIFEKFYPNRCFSKIWTRIEMCKIFCYSQKLSKIVLKFEIFEIFDQNRNFLKIWNFRPTSKIFKILTKFEIFYIFVHNQNFQQFIPK